MIFPRPYVVALLIFLFALVVRAYFLPFSLFDTSPYVPNETGPAVIYDGYFEIANNVMAGHGFTRSSAEPYVPDSVRLPLYPLFIIAVLKLFGSYKAFFIIQALLGSFSAVLAWMIAREFLGASLSAVVGILMALELYTAYLTGTIFTETLFTVIFLAFVYLFLRYLKKEGFAMLALASLVLGIATLIRPTTQYLPIFLLALLWWSNGFRFRKPLLKEACIVAGIFLLVLSPWLYRNYQTFGNPALVVQQASTLYAYLVPSAIALEEGISYEEAAARFFAEQNVGGVEDVNLSNSDEFTHRALAELRKHPVGLLKSIGITMYGFFTNDGYAGMLNIFFHAGVPYAHPPVPYLLTHPLEAISFFGNLMQGPGAIVILGRLFWVATTVLAALGVLMYWMRKGFTPELIFIVGVVAYFALTTIIIGLAVNARFRVPVEPLLFILATYALESVFRRLSHTYR